MPKSIKETMGSASDDALDAVLYEHWRIVKHDGASRSCWKTIYRGSEVECRAQFQAMVEQLRLLCGGVRLLDEEGLTRDEIRPNKAIEQTS